MTKGRDKESDRAWELMDQIMFCMLVTRKAGEIEARPMSAAVRKDEHAVYFLTDTDGVKDEEIRADPAVSLLFADPGGQKYVHVRGRAIVSNDRGKIRELWTPFAKAWWDSPEDPAVRVLKVTPESAEYWDSPGKLASYALMLAAAVTGAKPDVGDNEKVIL